MLCLQLLQEILGKLLVIAQCFRVTIESGRLDERAIESDLRRLNRCSGPHFVSCRDHQGIRAALNPQTIFDGRRMRGAHGTYLISKFLGRIGNIRIPSRRLFSHPNTTEIFVSETIPEPAGHLHQGVIGPSIASII